MGDKTGIEWTDATWNPLTGCKLVSPGCQNCYAAQLASGRLSHVPAYEGLAVDGMFTGEIRLLPERLDQPIRWKKPRRIFVNSMSDLFHHDVPIDFQQRVFDVMEEAKQHTFQILTKRPEIMRRRVLAIYGPSSWPGEHIWLGTSIESDDYVRRAEYLVQTPAAVRFLSCEPLLGPLSSLDLQGIDWVIVGGESGSHARPMNPEWARDLRDRTLDAGAAFHFKQWGEWLPAQGYDDGTHLLKSDGTFITRSAGTQRVDLGHGHYREEDLIDRGHPGWVRMRRPGKKYAGRELDGRTWDEYPAA